MYSLILHRLSVLPRFDTFSNIWGGKNVKVLKTPMIGKPTKVAYINIQYVTI